MVASAKIVMSDPAAPHTGGAARMLLRNGATVTIRPLQTGDETAITSWFAGLGPDTRHARFFQSLERLDRRVTSELARVDHLDHEAICAVSEGGDTVGIARYIRIGHSNRAELAVAVADDWTGQGLAGILLQHLAGRAREQGIDRFKATCLATNNRMIRLLSRLGATCVGPSSAGVVDVHIDLATPPIDLPEAH